MPPTMEDISLLYDFDAVVRKHTSICNFCCDLEQQMIYNITFASVLVG